MQEVAVPLTAAVVYFIYLVPVQTDGLGATVLFDGEGGRPDRMSFWSVGPFSILTPPASVSATAISDTEIEVSWGTEVGDDRYDVRWRKVGGS